MNLSSIMEKKKPVIAIVQARMNSSRFRGKVLKKTGDITCIELLLKRLYKSKLIDKIIVATSTNSFDDILHNKITSIGVECFRGDEINVLKRYIDAINKTTGKTIVRITGDCPLIDPHIVDKVINNFLEAEVDYASNVNPPTFPDGMSVEVISRNCLEKIYSMNLNSYHLEHVTTFIRENINFSKINLRNKNDFSGIRITLDEEIDLEVINSVVENFKPNIFFSLNDIINFYYKNKKIFKNSHIKRNSGSKIIIGQNK